MSYEYDLLIINNHLIMINNYKSILIDTGSPLTLCEDNEINLFNQNFSVQNFFEGINNENFINHVGMDIYCLLGMDILSKFDFLINSKKNKIIFY